jgi:hypothetical protein
MGKKAIAFQVKDTTVTGLELACEKCPMVLEITHEAAYPLPKHRCAGDIRDFDIVMELDRLVTRQSRIDRYWL